MDLSRVAGELAAREGGIRKLIWPVLVGARASCVAAQSRPEADDEIARIEELATADAEPIFLREEAALEKLAAKITELVDAMEEPTEAAEQLQSRASESADQARDWFARKLASIVAQARAGELQAGAPT